MIHTPRTDSRKLSELSAKIVREQIEDENNPVSPNISEYYSRLSVETRMKTPLGIYYDNGGVFLENNPMIRNAIEHAGTDDYLKSCLFDKCRQEHFNLMAFLNDRSRFRVYGFSREQLMRYKTDDS